MSDWNLRYATVGDTGIDYSKAVPCSKDSKCGFCNHLNKIEFANSDENGKSIDKDHASVIKIIKKLHKDGVYINNEPYFTPILTRAASKRIKNA
jgi:hypothetical protein